MGSKQLALMKEALAKRQEEEERARHEEEERVRREQEAIRAIEEKVFTPLCCRENSECKHELFEVTHARIIHILHNTHRR